LDLDQGKSTEWTRDLFPPPNMPSVNHQWENIYGTEGIPSVNAGFNVAFGSSFGGFQSLGSSLAPSGPPSLMRSPPGLIPSVGRDSPSAPPGLSNKAYSEKPDSPAPPPRRNDFLSYLNSTSDWKP
jgi:hypothetical protein